ncbi:acyl-CoA dehydrogenase family protein [Brevibacterium album]|uniref:acyl-CoA dehydrogenase family protein n=1 Tax=Brevibacterium album TaxID=417948 RepID=UPI0003F5CBE1|nr:acyl-CoA dehydrogenase family protein [Brevibacterium album]
MTTTATADTRLRTYWTGHADAEELARWEAVAERVAEALAADAYERDRANATPFAEAALLKDSGLTSLLVPAEFGGGGGHWESALRAVRILARTDGSIAQLLAYHYINEGNVVFGARSDAVTEDWLRRSADGRWIWGDSVNPTDPDLELVPEGEGFRLRGLKRYSTGSAVGDALVVNAVIRGGEHDGQVAALVLERGRAGVEHLDDWDFLGQRLSSSNSVRYHDVRVERGDILGHLVDEPFATLLTPGIQLMFGNLYLGLAEGALALGAELTRKRPNAWFLSAVERYRDDPFVKRLYGELVSRIAAVEALADRLNRDYDAYIGRGRSLTWEEREEAAIRIAQLKVVSSDLVTDLSNRIFEATGTSSTRTGVGLDLFWRNARTHTLHDPVDYKKLEVGAHFLNGETAPLSLYT